jgi:sugar phosphate permease
VVGILVSFSDRFAEKMGVEGSIDPGRAIMICYACLTLGDLASGYISQVMKSRKKVLYIFYTLTFISVLLYFRAYGVSETVFYSIIGLMGFSVGFWAIFVTVSAEQFGTNVRATAATTVPNFARGMLNIISLLFVMLQKTVFGLSYLQSGLITGLVCIAIAFIAAIRIDETFGKDLNYVEE